nr:hypothetical protein [Methylophaga pinxianii]
MDSEYKTPEAAEVTLNTTECEFSDCHCRTAC